MEIKTYTKESLIEEFIKINARGWVPGKRPGNTGNVGNTLEDLLGIPENNLPIPDAAEWELKAQRKKTGSRTSLFHSEPFPRAIKFVPEVFLINYGWRHKEAGRKYPETEKSFRQTICSNNCSDRGFKVVLDHINQRVQVSFDSTQIAPKHQKWAEDVQRNIGLQELNPQPYWSFDHLAQKANTKLHSCVYILADVKRKNGIEYFHYNDVTFMHKFSFENFLEGIATGNILIDIDARTGHNHGVKFRLRHRSYLPYLYEEAIKII